MNDECGMMNDECDISEGTLLFSNEKPSREEPYSLIFSRPVSKIILTKENAEESFRRIDEAIDEGYFGGGFFCYELNSIFDGIDERNKGRILGIWGVYDSVRIYDHFRNEWRCKKRGGRGDSDLVIDWQQEDSCFDTACLRGNDTCFLPIYLSAGAIHEEPQTQESQTQESSIKITSRQLIDFQQFKDAVFAIHEAIRRGETYQVNYTFPFELEVSSDSYDLYNYLLLRQPVPYASYQKWNEKQILSFSPELFFKRDGDRIFMRPMKGTAPRCSSNEDDNRIKVWLANDEKNRAENIMIVDLIRNDLGRIGRDVRVESLCDIEEYPTVWQMTSTVSCTVNKTKNFSEIFRSIFPSGSVTGAPKISTMKLIRKLEDFNRGVYCGALGYVLSPKEYRFSVPIRTIEYDPDMMIWKYSVGSGITIDSDAEKEYEECLQKAKFVIG